jgi:predicted phage terminase large subunit-like protein
MSLAGISQAQQADFGHALELANMHELARERLDWFAYACLRDEGLRRLVIEPYHMAWCELAERVARGHEKQVVITAPRGHAKSTWWSVALPAWFLACNPNRTVISVGNTVDIVAPFSKAVRSVIDGSPEFKALFPGVALDRELGEAVAHWYLQGQAAGQKDPNYVCAGIGGGQVGRRGDLIIIDDPIKLPQQVATEAQRDAMEQWFWQVLYPCRRNSETPVVVIGTRYHCLLPGNLLYCAGGSMVIEEVKPGELLLTSQGWQKALAVARKSHCGPVISLVLYGYPMPLNMTAEHRVLTARGWKTAGALEKLDCLMMPIPSMRDALPRVRSILRYSPPQSPNRTGLTGDKQAISRRALADLLGEGLTYEQIAHRFGRAGRSWTAKYAELYGLKKGRLNTLRGDPVVDPAFWRVVGLWIAEGSLSHWRPRLRRRGRHLIRWSFGHHEMHLAVFVRETLERYGIRTGIWKGKSTLVASCSNSQLLALLEHFGHGAAAKHVPDWVFGLPSWAAQNLVHGYVEGDGYLDRRKWVRVSSVCLPLLEGFQLLLAYLDVTASIMGGHKGGITAAAPSLCSANLYITQRRGFELRFPACQAGWLYDATQSVRSYGRAIRGQYVAVRIKSISVEQYTGPVYDVQTASHDFVANGIIVHNCDDLLGRLIARPDWKSVEFPAITADPETGEERALWPAKFPLAELHRLRDPETGMGSREFSCVYMCNPLPAEGGIIAEAWMRPRWPRDVPEPMLPGHWDASAGRYVEYSDREREEAGRAGRPVIEIVIQAWDVAESPSGSADFSAVVTLGMDQQGRMFGLDAWWGREIAPRLEERMVRAYEMWHPMEVLVEQASSGTALLQSIADSHPELPFEPVRADRNKALRLEAVAKVFEAGRVILPAGGPPMPTSKKGARGLRPWPDALASLVVGFPGAEVDDPVDALAYAVRRLERLHRHEPRIIEL